MNKKRDDEIYCPECSKVIKHNAVFCPGCGVKLKELKTIAKTPSVQVKTGTESKKKWVALVLALFFNFWAWLYTYKKSYKKFWIIFSITLVLSLMSFCIAIFITDAEGGGISDKYVSGWMLSVIIYFLCTELWILIDYGVKPKSFFEYYP